MKKKQTGITPKESPVSPQIPRKITAGPLKGRVFLLPASLFLALVVVFNLLPAPQTPFQALTTQALLRPAEAKIHFQLAQLYFAANNFAQAQVEAKTALALTPPKDSAGIKSYLNLLAQLQNEPGRLQAETSHWEKIVNCYPGYRDGYLILALLYRQLYRDTQALSSWQRAYNLDPNNETVLELKKVFIP